MATAAPGACSRPSWQTAPEHQAGMAAASGSARLFQHSSSGARSVAHSLWGSYNAQRSELGCGTAAAVGMAADGGPAKPLVRAVADARDTAWHAAGCIIHNLWDA